MEIAFYIFVLVDVGYIILIGYQIWFLFKLR